MSQRVPVQIDGHNPQDGNCICDYSCALRLFHIPSGEMITEMNHKTYVAHGKHYDEIARLCMEYSQECMMEEGSLEWTTVCKQRNIRALTSKTTNMKQATSTLVIITGKGKVGAGIFSRRYLMTLGVETATSLPFVREAIRRKMNIAILDPNMAEETAIITNTKPLSAMEVVEASLEELFFQNDDEQCTNSKQQLYVLAHSMAGSQLARYLLNKANPPLGEDVPETENVNGEERVQSILQQLQAVAYTDSNHNIQWVKKYPTLTKFLAGPKSLYIKSHKVHEDAKQLGDIAHEDDHFWKHRFGTIRTLWAGTNEHALTNHTGSSHIWEHFDSFR